MQSHPLRNLGLCALALLFLLALAAFVLLSVRIGSDVRAVGRQAAAQHGGDPVPALIRFVADPQHTLAERNRAVWALGQLGDPRALDELKRHLTGAPCNHTNALCQREIEKAIHLVQGGFNATAFIWRPWMRQ